MHLISPNKNLYPKTTSNQRNKSLQIKLNTMAGDHSSKIQLEDAKVYLHKQDKQSNSQNIHIDVEHPELNSIIKSGENTFVGGKEGGFFVGLKEEMIRRAENWVSQREHP